MDFLFDLAGPVAILLVFAFAVAEGGLLIGLFLPGEAPLIIAGVLAYQGRVSFVVVLVAACLGAVVGDSLGYWIGRRYGRRLEVTKVGRKVGRERWERSRTYVRERGGKAVFIGRFVSIFRTLAPPVAGSAHMPYRRFLAWNVPAALIFASGLVLAGYLAGSSWHLLEGYLGQASLVILIVLVVLVVFVIAARWVASNYARLHARVERFLARSRVRALRERYVKQIAFLGRRFDPGARFGLSLTIGVSVVLIIGFVFGEIFDEVAERDTGFIDYPLLSFFVDHRSPEVTAAMKVITFFGGSVVALVILSTAVVLSYFRTKDFRYPAFLAFCVVGALGLSPLIKVVIQRPRPQFSQVFEIGGFAFPSGHATTSTIVFASLAYVLSRSESWRVAVWIWAASGFAAFLIGFSRLYLGVHWPTDVIGGWVLGLLWVATGVVITNLAWEVTEVRRDRTPTSSLDERDRATSRR